MKPGADFSGQFRVLIIVDILIFLSNDVIIKQLEVAIINGRIIVIKTLLAGSRGDVYKKMSGLK